MAELLTDPQVWIAFATLTALELADGRVLPVVRCVVAEGAAVPPPPPGTVVQTGILFGVVVLLLVAMYVGYVYVTNLVADGGITQRVGF